MLFFSLISTESMEALVTFFNTLNPSGASTQGQFNGGVSEIVVSRKLMKFQIWVNYPPNNILLAVLVLNCGKNIVVYDQKCYYMLP